ncbi:carbonic anhydrase 12 [Trichomycterus rosablanca]|uniref:carbonic anhydrase 12 n=1 Tax=Trichomycterus rosablanca TaxID=2290929 RepID=UPI002F351280
MLLTLISLFIIIYPRFSNGKKWTYDGPDGEHHWSSNYPYCGGAFQSPINFQPKLLRYDPDLLPIQLQNYNLSSSEQLTLSNNGHSVQLSLPSRMQLVSLPDQYSAAQLHFHWGSANVLAGSEHAVNGKQFPAELHLVHFNSARYPNISMAVDKSDGLAVLGVFIEVGEFNPAFDQFLKFVQGIKYKDQKVQIPAFNIQKLLPAYLDEYYRYDGSLTTPPCYPSVLWTVFKDPVTISLSQYLTLVNIPSTSNAQESVPVPMFGNHRKPMPMDNRVVLVSFQDSWGLHGSLSVASPMQRRLAIQQLLRGDLADLADEGLHHLLPKLRNKPWAPKKLNSNQRPKPSSQVAKKLPSTLKSAINDDVLCFVSLEKNVSLEVSRRHAESQIIHALKKAVFPKLNLHSYLNCRSDLDLQTIRYLIYSRPGDEAEELDQALTRAIQRQKPLKQHQGSALSKLTRQTKAAGIKNSQDVVFANHRLQAAEWED